jgi:hypothetical protein
MTLTTVPDLVNFKFRTPPFEYTNQIWSVSPGPEIMSRSNFILLVRRGGGGYEAGFLSRSVETERCSVARDRTEGQIRHPSQVPH